MKQFLIDSLDRAIARIFFEHIVFASLWCVTGARRYEAFAMNTSIFQNIPFEALTICDYYLCASI